MKTVHENDDQKQGEEVISRVIKPTDNYRPGVQVRLVAADNEQIGIVTIEQALDKAEEAGLDLVLVADKSTPPVCRIMDFKKKQYEAKKAQREAKKKQTHQKVKEIKFHANIDPHDFGIKTKRIGDFIAKGHKVKISLFLRGREMGFQEKAMNLMLQVIEDLGEAITVEARPKMVKRNISMMLAPNTGKKK